MMPLQQSSQIDDGCEPGTEAAVERTSEVGPEAPADPPIVLLRGTRAGLEIVIDASASLDEIVSQLTSRLEQSPAFFAGNDVAVRTAGRLPRGALARLEETAARFGLHIAELGPRRLPDESEPEEAVREAPVRAGPAPPGPRMVIGPIRSGVVLDAPADLIVVGDVNPGAEIQACGNILVMGRLRGVAHAAVGGEKGFIFALRFEPQQLRIGRLVARAGESDAPGQGAEIAYATGRTIVVERYQGRLPSGLDAAA